MNSSMKISHVKNFGLRWDSNSPFVFQTNMLRLHHNVFIFHLEITFTHTLLYSHHF